MLPGSEDGGRQRKLLMKTAVVKKDLNPHWDPIKIPLHLMEVDIDQQEVRVCVCVCVCVYLRKSSGSIPGSMWENRCRTVRRIFRTVLSHTY